jgi:hypothetical protein
MSEWFYKTGSDYRTITVVSKAVKRSANHTLACFRPVAIGVVAEEVAEDGPVTPA